MNNINNVIINEEFSSSYQMLEESMSNIFVTGRAGTGKSTLLQYFRDNTVKNVVVLAPTGVAALNVKGQTIHSFFRFRTDITPEGVDFIKIRKNRREIYKKIDVLIIDEISMVRADLFDCIDAFLRRFGKNSKAPFGGVQLILFGDLFQLPPVVTKRDKQIFKDVYKSPYFFDALCFPYIKLEIIELENIYRQKDNKFIDILNAIRDRSASDAHLKELNKRCIPGFVPDKNDIYIYLTTTNSMADSINDNKLNTLKTCRYTFEGIIEGDFGERDLPTKASLDVKFGAQVMLLNNDSEGKWINGSIGKIVSVKERKDQLSIVNVELLSGDIVEVTPFKWEVFKFFYNEELERLESESVGSFTQYPIRLAWAITIHKSQGKTFRKVIIDIGRGAFACGQIYVALSRCTELDGIILRRSILKRDIIVDTSVQNFIKNNFKTINSQEKLLA